MSRTLSNTFKTFVVLALLGVAYVACANPLELSTSNITATTTVSYMTPGTATTTYYFDSYSGNGTGYGMDSANLLVQLTASGTSQIRWGYEYSMGVAGVDCTTNPGACDWYKDDMQLPVTATSTQQYNLSAPIEYTWTFATTSQGYANAAPNRALKVMTVPTPTRYVRVIFSIPAGSVNAGVWAAFIPQKQSTR